MTNMIPPIIVNIFAVIGVAFSGVVVLAVWAYMTDKDPDR